MRRPLVTRVSKAALQATDQLIGPDAADVAESVHDDVEPAPDVVADTEFQTVWNSAPVTEIIGPHSTIVAFNYASLPPDLAQEARDAVVRIHKAEDNFIFKAGDALAAIRQKMEHGRWLAWLEYEVGISDQTALNYIAYFEFLTQRADITLVGVMAPSAIYALARAPEMVQDRLIKRAKDGERVTAKIVEMACRAQLALEQQDEPNDALDGDSDAPEPDDDAAPEQDDVTARSDADTTDDAAPEPLEEVAEAFAIALMKLLQANPQRSKYYQQALDLSRHAYQCQEFMTRLAAGLRPRRPRP